MVIIRNNIMIIKIKYHNEVKVSDCNSTSIICFSWFVKNGGGEKRNRIWSISETEHWYFGDMKYSHISGSREHLEIIPPLNLYQAICFVTPRIQLESISGLEEAVAEKIFHAHYNTIWRVQASHLDIHWYPFSFPWYFRNTGEIIAVEYFG